MLIRVAKDRALPFDPWQPMLPPTEPCWKQSRLSRPAAPATRRLTHSLMPSTQQPDLNQVAASRASDYAETFLNDWHRLGHASRNDQQRLKQTMLLIVQNTLLGAVSCGRTTP